MTASMIDFLGRTGRTSCGKALRKGVSFGNLFLTIRSLTTKETREEPLPVAIGVSHHHSPYREGIRLDEIILPKTLREHLAYALPITTAWDWFKGEDLGRLVRDFEPQNAPVATVGASVVIAPAPTAAKHSKAAITYHHEGTSLICLMWTGKGRGGCWAYAGNNIELPALLSSESDPVHIVGISIKGITDSGMVEADTVLVPKWTGVRPDQSTGTHDTQQELIPKGEIGEVFYLVLDSVTINTPKEDDNLAVAISDCCKEVDERLCEAEKSAFGPPVDTLGNALLDALELDLHLKCHRFVMCGVPFLDFTGKASVHPSGRTLLLDGATIASRRGHHSRFTTMRLTAEMDAPLTARWPTIIALGKMTDPFGKESEAVEIYEWDPAAQVYRAYWMQSYPTLYGDHWHCKEGSQDTHSFTIEALKSRMNNGR